MNLDAVSLQFALNFEERFVYHFHWAFPNTRGATAPPTASSSCKITLHPSQTFVAANDQNHVRTCRFQFIRRSSLYQQETRLKSRVQKQIYIYIKVCLYWNMSKDVTKHVAHILREILLSMMIKYQVTISYIFCFIQKCHPNVTLYNS